VFGVRITLLIRTKLILGTEFRVRSWLSLDTGQMSAMAIFGGVSVRVDKYPTFVDRYIKIICKFSSH